MSEEVNDGSEILDIVDVLDLTTSHLSDKDLQDVPIPPSLKVSQLHEDAKELIPTTFQNFNSCIREICFSIEFCNAVERGLDREQIEGHR